MNTTLQRLVISVLCGAVVAGCGSNVRLEPPTIPEPLINTLPMTVAVRLPENFQHFVHEEEVLGREQWTIDLGSSNATFFTQLFGYMFENVEVVDAAVDIEDGVYDALLEPSIDAFEFSVPNQTKTDSFAVWIRYRVKVYDGYGELLLDAPVSAYGKSLTTTLGGSRALQNAAVLAMRDAAALMIMKFDEQTLFTSFGTSATAQGSETGATVTKTALGGKQE